MNTERCKPVKVWSWDRHKKRAVFAASLNQLLENAKSILDLRDPVADYAVYLEEDGTLITDNDYFQTLPDQTVFLVLSTKKERGHFYTKGSAVPSCTVTHMHNTTNVISSSHVQVGSDNFIAGSPQDNLQDDTAVGEYSSNESDQTDTKLRSYNDSMEDSSTVDEFTKRLFDSLPNKKKMYWEFDRLISQISVNEARDKMGYSILHLAAIHNRWSILVTLWRYTRDWNDLLSLAVTDENDRYFGYCATDIADDIGNKRFMETMDNFTKKEASLKPIHRAVRNKDLGEVVKLCKEDKDNANLVVYLDDDTYTCPLYVAVTVCQEDDKDIVNSLVEYGASLQFVDDTGQSLLSRACYVGNTKMVVHLLEIGQIEMDFKDDSGNRALDYAALHNFDDIIDILVKYESLPNGQSLCNAAKNGHRLLMEDIVQKHNIQVNSKDSNGCTALLYSCLQNEKPNAKSLLKLGASLSLVDRANETCMHKASRSGHVTLVNLLSTKAPIQILKQNIFIESELIYLVRGKDKDKPAWHYINVKRSLLDVFLSKAKGGTVKLKDYGDIIHSGWGIDPPNEIRKEVDMMYNLGNKASNCYHVDMTPLHLATLNKNWQTVQMLLEMCPHEEKHHLLAMRDCFGMTALHIAAMRGHVPTVLLFLENGADFHLKDKDDKSPAEVAISNNHSNVAGILEKELVARMVQTLVIEPSSAFNKELKEMVVNEQKSLDDMKKIAVEFGLNQLQNLHIIIGDFTSRHFPETTSESKDVHTDDKVVRSPASRRQPPNMFSLYMQFLDKFIK